MRAIGRSLILLVLAVVLVACDSSGRKKDTTAPVITLVGDNPQVIEAGTPYVELGGTASDNRDGDLSNTIVIDASQVDTSVPGSYAVTYSVTDAAGNAGSTTRTVSVEDTTPPVITLVGDDPQIIVAPNPYIEHGATAADTLDGDLSAQIIIDATAVDTMVAGDYAVTYDVTDAAGNTAVTVSRTVRVELPLLPSAPEVSVEGDIKQLIFSWDDVADADYYKLLENPDGHSGFSQVGDDIPMGTLSATRDIAVHLHDWANALYTVQACNLGGCTGSAESTPKDVMLDTIGYWKASNSEAGDKFGRSVAISGDGRVLAVGAPDEDSGATGIGGDESSNSEELSGAVYVFRNRDGFWSQEAYVKASNAESPDYFGISVSLSDDGNTLAVGAKHESGGDGHINGNEWSNAKGLAGAAYIFRHDGSAWFQEAYIKAANSGIGDLFGASVSLSADGNTLAVGAPDEGSSSIGVNGEPYDNSAPYSGAAYIYRYENEGWMQQAYVKASNTDPEDRFGGSLVLSADGNTLAVSATGEDSFDNGINGDQADNTSQEGAVYLFRFNGENWGQEAYIKASNSKGAIHCWWPVPKPCNMTFGASVALSYDGNTLVVGATGESSDVTGINNYRPEVWSGASGAAYLFRFDGMSWDQEAHIKPSNTHEGANFGAAVALSDGGDRLVVGAPFEHGGATGIDGDQTDSTKQSSGAVYLFCFDGSTWSQKAYIKAANTDAEDWFGWSLALSADGDVLASGGAGEDGAADGIGGDQTDNSRESAGAVYVY